MIVASLFSTILLCTTILTQCRSAPVGGLLDSLSLFKHGNISNTPPSKDPFYRFGDIGPLESGTVIAKRRVTAETYVKSVHLAEAVQMLYKTTTADDTPDATVNTVFVPKKPAHPARVLAVQMFSDSAAVDCAASWSMISGSKSMANTLDTLQTIIVLQALKSGMYVSVADFEGSKAAFSSRAEGRAVLDGVRSLLSDRDVLADVTGAQVVLSGYSGGAHATVSAIQQAAQHAPELNIVGASFGGTPIDPLTTLNKLNGGESSYFALAGLAGLMNAYPELDAFVSQHMYSNGTDAITAMRSSCYIDSYSKWKNVDVYTYTSLGRRLFDEPIMQKYLAKEIIGKDESGKPVVNTKFPMHIYHATKEPMIPFEPVVDYVSTQCRYGASIQFDTDSVPNHSGELLKNMGSNFNWIQACFDGEYTKMTGCKRKNDFF